MITLYSYFRSSASFRVRIALNLKGLSYDTRDVHLVNNGGEQKSDEYTAINPQQLVPALVDNVSSSEMTIGQSVAMMEYLEEQYPDIALLPTGISDRAKVRALTQLIATDVHPLDNLRVLQYLKNTLEITDDQKMAWYFHWIEEGFTAFEALLRRYADEQGIAHDQLTFCFGNQVSMADCCLIPQVYNAKRFEMDLSAYPLITQINDHCLSLQAFRDAYPVAPE